MILFISSCIKMELTCWLQILHEHHICYNWITCCIPHIRELKVGDREQKCHSKNPNRSKVGHWKTTRTQTNSRGQHVRRDDAPGDAPATRNDSDYPQIAITRRCACFESAMIGEYSEMQLRREMTAWRTSFRALETVAVRQTLNFFIRF